jgi:hypothetical protein
MELASSRRMLKVAPPTSMAIGQPSGAKRETVIVSPGKHPISNSFCFITSSVNDSITQLLPLAILFSVFVAIIKKLTLINSLKDSGLIDVLKTR